MFAVIRTGGKQYRVAVGNVLRIEKLAANAGEKVQFKDVLMVGANVGTPLLKGAAVEAEVLDQIKGEKVINFVKRRRKHSSKRTKGHRQNLTVVKVTKIVEKGAGEEKPKAAAPKKEKTPAVKADTKADAKTTKAAAKPKAEAKPKTAAKPKAATKPKTAAKPKTAKAASEKTKAAKPATKKAAAPKADAKKAKE